MGFIPKRPALDAVEPAVKIDRIEPAERTVGNSPFLGDVEEIEAGVVHNPVDLAKIVEIGLDDNDAGALQRFACAAKGGGFGALKVELQRERPVQREFGH